VDYITLFRVIFTRQIVYLYLFISYLFDVIKNITYTYKINNFYNCWYTDLIFKNTIRKLEGKFRYDIFQLNIISYYVKKPKKKTNFLENI